MTGHHWPPESPPHALGALAHGPAILARGPGIVVGLRCVFAHPTGLHLPLVFRAGEERFGDVQAWSYGKLRMYRTPEEQRADPYSEPSLTVQVNARRGPAHTKGGRHAGDDENLWARDADYWIDELPHDGRLVLTVSWPEASLPETRTDLELTGLDDLSDTVLRLL